jgi:hypothetical protein
MPSRDSLHINDSLPKQLGRPAQRRFQHRIIYPANRRTNFHPYTDRTPPVPEIQRRRRLTIVFSQYFYSHKETLTSAHS